MEVTCSQCSTRYMVPDEKVRGRKVRLPCRRCGNAIIIDARSLGAGPKPAVPIARLPALKRTQVGGLQAPPPPSSAAPHTWSVSLDGHTRDLNVREIAEGYRAGTLGGSAYVWRRGMPDWVLLAEAAELADALEKLGVDVRAPESSTNLGEAFDDENETTRILSGPAASLAPMAADLEDEQTRVLTGPPSGSSKNAFNDEDEVTRLFDGGPPKGPEPAAPASTPAGARHRAEQAVALAPPRSAAAAAPEVESTVVVADESLRPPPAAEPKSDAPAAPPPTPVRPAPDPASQTQKITRTAPRSSLPLGTILLVAVLAGAAGTAGYLLSQVVQSEDPGPPAEETVVAAPAADDLPDPTGTVAQPPAATDAATAPTEGDVPPEEEPTEEEPTEEEPTEEERRAPQPSAAPTKRAAPVRKARTTAVTSASVQPSPTAPAPEAPAPAEPGAPPAAPSLGPLDRAAAERAMNDAARSAEQGCSRAGEPNGSAVIWLSLVQSGKAVGVSLKGPLSGTTTGLCVLRSFFKVTVPPFSGEPVPMSREVQIR
jgi:predicted Zn finger-like uncharacterized protein